MRLLLSDGSCFQLAEPEADDSAVLREALQHDGTSVAVPYSQEQMLVWRSVQSGAQLIVELGDALSAAEVSNLAGGSSPTPTPTYTMTPTPTPTSTTPTPTVTPDGYTNVALGATPSTSYVSSWETLDAINDDYQPSDSQDKGPGAYGNWPETGVQWVQYDFDQNYTIDEVTVYWWDDNLGIDLPSASNVQYWNGSSFVDVPNAVGNGTADHQYNVTTFDAVTTDAIRLEITSNGDYSTGILEFQVFEAD